MATASVRLAWLDVPDALRAAVGDLLGSPVVEASSQTGGFSPGSADRVVTAAGVRAFVKTASTRINADSVEIHRQEAAMAGSLPTAAHAPELLGFVDLDDWVAIVLEDIEGSQPAVPWSASDLHLVLDALVDVTRDPVGADFHGPALADAISPQFSGWSELLLADRLPHLGAPLSDWLTPRLPLLAEMSAAAVDDLVGDHLVHGDVRADNILLRVDRGVTLVDWPWACRGARWFDALSLLVNVRLYDPTADVERVIADHDEAFAQMDPDAATRVLAGLAGFFLAASMKDPVPALPTLRSFQFDQGVVTLEWLRERMA